MDKSTGKAGSVIRWWHVMAGLLEGMVWSMAQCHALSHFCLEFCTLSTRYSHFFFFFCGKLDILFVTSEETVKDVSSSLFESCGFTGLPFDLVYIENGTFVLVSLSSVNLYGHKSIWLKGRDIVWSQHLLPWNICILLTSIIEGSVGI